jgi:hypothetical protein
MTADDPRAPDFIQERLLVTGKGQDRVASAVLVPAYIEWHEARTGLPMPKRTAALALAEASRSYRDPKTGAKFRSMTSQGSVFYVGVTLV